MKGRPRGARWEATRAIVLARDGYQCRKCGSARRLEVDHIHGWRGCPDPYAPQACQTLCASCHLEKSRAEGSIRNPGPRERAWDSLVNERIKDHESDGRRQGAASA